MTWFANVLLTSPALLKASISSLSTRPSRLTSERVCSPYKATASMNSARSRESTTPSLVRSASFLYSALSIKASLTCMVQLIFSSGSTSTSLGSYSSSPWSLYPYGGLSAIITMSYRWYKAPLFPWYHVRAASGVYPAGGASPHEGCHG